MLPIPVRTAAPAATIVSRDEAKAHLRIDFTDDDTYIDTLIDVATSHVDGHSGVLGRALITQTWRQNRDGFGASQIRLPLAPAQSITSVTYWDESDVEQTVSASDYRLATDGLSDFIELVSGSSWPSTATRFDAVSITAVYGYGDASTDVPSAIRHAALLLIAHWYENREAVAAGVSMTEVPMAVHSLLAPFRRIGV